MNDEQILEASETWVQDAPPATPRNRIVVSLTSLGFDEGQILNILEQINPNEDVATALELTVSEYLLLQSTESFNEVDSGFAPDEPKRLDYGLRILEMESNGDMEVQEEFKGLPEERDQV